MVHFANVGCLAGIIGFLHDHFVLEAPLDIVVAFDGHGGRPGWCNAPAIPAWSTAQPLIPAATAKGSGQMSFVSTIIGTAEWVPLPDAIIRAAIHRLCSRTAMRLATGHAESDAWFADEMAARAIAEHGDETYPRHDELPAAFFEKVLGPNRKYSSCFYKEPVSTLQEAEEEALRQTVEHADLADGQSILELGCGWGSLSLWMARQFPHSDVVAVSNSLSQREYIEGEAAKRGLANLRAVTSDMNAFDPGRQFDRIVSVEMFEHMMDWRELLARVRSYLFDRSDSEDWIAPHFFTGGVMPSHHLVRQYADLFGVEKEWRWSGTHYQRTAQDWLANFDAHRDGIEPILRKVHGDETALWMRRWRWFFLATSGLFGYADGSEWGVSHYRMKAA
jgi:cyclopropane-fatty-acyl-phospholipid synthase